MRKTHAKIWRLKSMNEPMKTCLAFIADLSKEYSSFWGIYGFCLKAGTFFLLFGITLPRFIWWVFLWFSLIVAGPWPRCHGTLYILCLNMRCKLEREFFITIPWICLQLFMSKCGNAQADVLSVAPFKITSVANYLPYLHLF